MGIILIHLLLIKRPVADKALGETKRFGGVHDITGLRRMVQEEEGEGDA
jgi:hypothetical protein